MFKSIGISFNRVYGALSIKKQSVHAHLKRQNRKDEQYALLEILVKDIRDDHPVMGLRKIHRMLIGIDIGRDEFERYFAERGYLVKRSKNYRRTTDSRGVTKFDNVIKDLSIHRIDQVWVSDITYFELGSRFYYLTFILDLFSRRIVGHSISGSLDTSNTTIAALEKALRLRKYSRKNTPKKLILHSDGGCQYYSKDFIKILREHGVQSSMAESVYENPAAERVNGIIKNEYLIHRHMQSMKQLTKETDRAVGLYNSSRPHKSINQLTPVQFEASLT